MNGLSSSRLRIYRKGMMGSFDLDGFEGTEIYVDGNSTGITTKKLIDNNW